MASDLNFFFTPGGVLLPDDPGCQGGRWAGAQGDVQGVQQRQLWLCPSRGDQVFSFYKNFNCFNFPFQRFVLMHLPGKITYKEIDEMIKVVDKNEDRKISYSEFRVKIFTDCLSLYFWLISPPGDAGSSAPGHLGYQQSDGDWRPGWQKIQV